MTSVIQFLLEYKKFLAEKLVEMRKNALDLKHNSKFDEAKSLRKEANKVAAKLRDLNALVIDQLSLTIKENEQVLNDEWEILSQEELDHKFKSENKGATGLMGPKPNGHSGSLIQYEDNWSQKK